MKDKTGDRHAKRKRGEEINFLKQVQNFGSYGKTSLKIQACLQAFVFCCELITYFVLSSKVENSWARFFLTTVAWNLVHCTDGMLEHLIKFQERRDDAIHS